MAKTEVRSGQILNATVGRSDVNIATPGEAITTKIVAGTGISISSTGADTGTGDVTITSTGGAGGAHHATHEPGGADALVNAAWLNLANVFTKTFAIGIANHALSLQSALPLMSFVETGAAANSKLWRLYANAAAFSIQATNDDDASATGTITISRTGRVLSQELLVQNATNPRIAWCDDSQAVDARVFEIRNQTAQLIFSAVNDSQSAVISTPLILGRGGSVQVGNNLTVLGSGGNVACKDQSNVFTIGQSISTSLAVLVLTSTTGTNSAYIGFSNSGGVSYLAIENSTGTQFAATPYALVLYAPTSRGVEIFTNASKRLTIDVSGNATFAGMALITGRTVLYGGTTGNYGQGPLEIQMAGNPRVSFHWPGLIASQLGMDSAGTIRTFDNPGTGYAAFACASLACGAINSSGSVTVTGGLLAYGGVNSQANTFSLGYIQSRGVVYPGRVDNGLEQLSWYIAGHGSYGLYCNTGLASAGSYWELGRSTQMGYWIAWSPVFYTEPGHAIGGTITAAYCLVGKMLYWYIYCVNFNNPVVTNYLRCSVPIAASTNIVSAGIRIFIPGVGDRFGYTAFEPDVNWLSFRRGDTGATWPVGVGHIIGQGFYPIG